MKKTLSLMLAASLSLALAVTAPPNARAMLGAPEPVPGEVSIALFDNQIKRPQYVSQEGKIVEVNRADDMLSILVDHGDGNECVYHINDSVLLLSAQTQDIAPPDQLEAGQTVLVAYLDNTPVLMSLPAQMTPGVIVLTDGEDVPGIKAAYFDETGLSADGELIIHADGVEARDIDGNPVPGDQTLPGDLLVFYTVTTRSIPPQTTPSKIFALPSDAQRQARWAIDNLEDERKTERDGVQYVQLRFAAESLNYEVEWIQDEFSVVLNNGDVSFKLHIGDAGYSQSGESLSLENPVFLLDDRTYVESGFIETLAGQLTVY